jgi:hypothetical protein
MNEYFKGMNLNLFWDKKFDKNIPKKLTNEMVKNAEEKLKYKLPLSYIELLKNHNGGYPLNTYFQIKDNKFGQNNYIEIVKIFGIGTDDGIDSEYGSDYLINEWEYPNIGILICSCPSAGHDSVFFDYSECGINGEPKIVHIDLEISEEPVITILANNFEEFICGLSNEKDVKENDKKIVTSKIIKASYSSELLKMLKEYKE